MNPIVFEGCFGWLHPASGTRGVVLCNAYGQEAVWTHKGYRQLAERCAAAGMPTLRFDYHGTGDSAGDERDPAGLDAWIGSIKAAVATLKAHAGVTEVVLVGLRLGASLAALAAEQLGGVAGIVMMSPVVSGKSYLREMRVLHQTWQSGVDVEPSPEAALGECIEVIGHVLYPATIAQLSVLDLRQAAVAPAPRILFMDRTGRESRAAAERYETLGCTVETQIFQDYDRFMIESAYSEVPHKVFDAVVAWSAAGAFTTRPHDAPEPVAALVPEPMLELREARETPVRFGTNGLFGVLCEPVRGTSRAPAVLFANTGAAHHVGDGRLAVTLARRLARRGIASLRIDVGGLGDSDAAAWTANMDVLYTNASVADVGTAADWLAEHGYPRVVLCGVCSGAYIGLHAALTNDHVVGLLSVNLARFLWPEGLTLKGAATRRAESTRLFMRSAMSLEKWGKVLRGRANFTLKVAVVAGRLARRLHAQLAIWGVDHLGAKVGNVGRVWELVRTLEARQVQTRLVYGAFDAGLDELATWFGARGRRLGKLSHVRVSVMEKVDHALIAATARERVMRFVEDFLEETYNASVVHAETAPKSPLDLHLPSAGRPRQPDRTTSIAFLDKSAKPLNQNKLV